MLYSLVNIVLGFFLFAIAKVTNPNADSTTALSIIFILIGMFSIVYSKIEKIQDNQKKILEYLESHKDDSIKAKENV